MRRRRRKAAEVPGCTLSLRIELRASLGNTLFLMSLSLFRGGFFFFFFSGCLLAGTDNLRKTLGTMPFDLRNAWSFCVASLKVWFCCGYRVPRLSLPLESYKDEELVDNRETISPASYGLIDSSRCDYLVEIVMIVSISPQ